MAWQRGGDTAATYPPLLATRGDPGADDRTVNEVRGFIWALSTQSGAHLTDYVLDIGTIEMFGGPRTEALLRHATRHGLLTRVRTPHGPGYRLVDDPDFIHLRSRADVEWSRQQMADTRDLALIVPIRLRDGDQCRWCGVEVVWLGRKTARSAEPDHLRPGEPGGIESMVVACRRCNRARGGNREGWDSAHQLLPAPARPRYGEATAAFLTRNGYPTEPNDGDGTMAPAFGAEPAPQQGVRPATGLGDASTAPLTAPGNVPRNSPESEFRGPSVGTGRDGSGQAVTGGDGRGSDVTGSGGSGSSGAARRRRRRGHRGGGEG